MFPVFRSDAFKLAVFVAATAVLAALLAPALDALGQWALREGHFDSGPLAGWRESVERAQITRYFNRAVMLSVLALAWPFLKWIGIRSEGGLLLLRKNPRRWAHLAAGFALAAGSLLLLGAFYVKIGWYSRIRTPARCCRASARRLARGSRSE